MILEITNNKILCYHNPRAPKCFKMQKYKTKIALFVCNTVLIRIKSKELAVLEKWKL